MLFLRVLLSILKWNNLNLSENWKQILVNKFYTSFCFFNIIYLTKGKLLNVNKTFQSSYLTFIFIIDMKSYLYLFINMVKIAYFFSKSNKTFVKFYVSVSILLDLRLKLNNFLCLFDIIKKIILIAKLM